MYLCFSCIIFSRWLVMVLCHYHNETCWFLWLEFLATGSHYESSKLGTEILDCALSNAIFYPQHTVQTPKATCQHTTWSKTLILGKSASCMRGVSLMDTCHFQSLPSVWNVWYWYSFTVKGLITETYGLSSSVLTETLKAKFQILVSLKNYNVFQTWIKEKQGLK